MSKPLKSLKFPESEEIYTIPQISPDLKTPGQSADSAATGQALDEKLDKNRLREANGTEIVVEDSSDRSLYGLNLYGKTAQGENPSIENPQELVSAGYENGKIEEFILNDKVRKVEKSGPVVTCNPIIGYPIEVGKVKIEVNQLGATPENPPSPSHICPIKPWEQIKLTRCGSNLLNPMTKNHLITDSTGTIKNETEETISFVIEVRGNINIQGPIDKVDSKVYRIGSFDEYPRVGLKGSRANQGNGIFKCTKRYTLITIVPAKGENIVDIIDQFYASVDTIENENSPYNGEAYTVQLPSKIYGGEVDWESGKITNLYEKKTFTGTTANGGKINWVQWQDKTIFTDTPVFDYSPDDLFTFCNTHKWGWENDIYITSEGVLRIEPNLGKNYTLESWKAELDATPLEIVYPVKDTTKSIQLEKPENLVAISGVNTLYANTGDISLSCYEPETLSNSDWQGQKMDVPLLPMDLEKSGPVVEIKANEGEPLHVVSNIDVKQDGEGDPSPENVRRIRPATSCEMTRCGKNLLRFPSLDTDYKIGYNNENYDNSGIAVHVQDDGRILISGTAVKTFYFNLSHEKYYGGSMSTAREFEGGNPTNGCLVMSGFDLGTNADGLVYGDGISVTFIRVEEGTTVNHIVSPQIELGSIATPYEPYVGDTYTADLTSIKNDIPRSGQVISIDDSEDLPLKDLHIYGKTVQNGVPTPEAPVALETAGRWQENLNEFVAGENLLDNTWETVEGYQLSIQQHLPAGTYYMRRWSKTESNAINSKMTIILNEGDPEPQWIWLNGLGTYDNGNIIVEDGTMGWNGEKQKITFKKPYLFRVQTYEANVAITVNDYAKEYIPYKPIQKLSIPSLKAPFAASGAIATCNPVPGSQLNVKTFIEPQQEGTGDPSPDNVRPIVATDRVELVRCGVNLLNVPEITGQNGGIKFAIHKDASVELTGNSTSGASYYVSHSPIPAGRYRLSAKTLSGKVTDGFVNFRVGIQTVRVQPSDPNPSTIIDVSAKDGKADYLIFVYKNTTSDGLTLQISLTPENNAVVTPYTGTTYTAQLPPDTYGGEVDWEKGVAKSEWVFVSDSGSDGWKAREDGLFEFNTQNPILSIQGQLDIGLCNIFTYLPVYLGDSVYVSGSYILVGKTLAEKFNSIDEFKAQLAKTPLEICVKLNSGVDPAPITISSTPTTLPGTNNLYSDTGDTTVSGKYYTGLPGIPVESGGNYTDENGQQWICDEIDFEKGVYIQRVGTYIIKEAQSDNSGTAGKAFMNSAINPIPLNDNRMNKGRAICDTLPIKTDWDHETQDGIVAYQFKNGGFLQFSFMGTFPDIQTKEEMTKWLSRNPMRIIYEISPKEIPLPAEILNAYRALHTNEPNTTVFNDAGAEQKMAYQVSGTYGGSLDWNEQILTRTMKIVDIDKLDYGAVVGEHADKYIRYFIFGYPQKVNQPCFCSILPYYEAGSAYYAYAEGTFKPDEYKVFDSAIHKETLKKYGLIDGDQTTYLPAGKSFFKKNNAVLYSTSYGPESIQVSENKLQIVTIDGVNTLYSSTGDTTVSGKFLTGLPGIPVESGQGNWTDSQGQEWLSDEIDFDKGIYIKRVQVNLNYKNESITTKFISSTGSLTEGCQVIYTIPEQTIPLSEIDPNLVEKYRKLYTISPKTIAYNDAGAQQKLTYQTAQGEYHPSFNSKDSKPNFGIRNQIIASDGRGGIVPVNFVDDGHGHIRISID